MIKFIEVSLKNNENIYSIILPILLTLINTFIAYKVYKISKVTLDLQKNNDNLANKKFIFETFYKDVLTNKLPKIYKKNEILNFTSDDYIALSNFAGDFYSNIQVLEYIKNNEFVELQFCIIEIDDTITKLANQFELDCDLDQFLINNLDNLINNLYKIAFKTI